MLALEQLFHSNPGTGIAIFIQTKALYIPNHELETGDRVAYSPGNGSGIISFETGAERYNFSRSN